MLFSPTTFADHSEHTDSVKRILYGPDLPVEEKLRIYEELSANYCASNIDSTFYYSRKGLDLALEANDYQKEGSFYRYIGGGYDVIGGFDSAIYYYKKSYDLALRINDNQMEGQAYGMYAFSYFRQGKYLLALQWSRKVLEHYHDSDYMLPKIGMMGYIGEIYQILGNHEMAFFYIEKALKMAEDLNNVFFTMQLYNRMGAIYIDLKEYDKALEYLELGLKAGTQINHQLNICISHRKMAQVHLERKNYEKAFEEAEEAVTIARKVSDPTILAGSLSILSDIYREQQKYTECEAAAFDAWQTDSINMELAPNLAYNLAISNIHLKNEEKALYFIQKTGELNKDRVGKEIHQALLDMEVKNESEKNEFRISALEKEKNLNRKLNIASGIILLLLSGMFIFILRFLSQKRKIAEQQIQHLEQEKQLITAQALLEGETNERKRLARDLHDGLGGILSVAKLHLKDLESLCIEENATSSRFTHTFHALDTGMRELRCIAHHMMPESLMRAGLKTSIDDFCKAIPGAHFDYIGNEKRLDTHLEILIYRCVYELVNNALKYAEASHIKVQMIAEDNFVSLTVHDDGIGFNPKNITPGAGLENIRNRVAAYNGIMTIYTSPGKGTEVTIEIELRRRNNLKV